MGLAARIAEAIESRLGEDPAETGLADPTTEETQR